MPTNYAAEQNFTDNTEAEKRKLLKLMADHGSQGAQIYEEARNRVAGITANAEGQATSIPNVDVPMAAIQEAKGRIDSRQAAFQNILRSAQDQAEVDMRNRAAAGAIYHDSLMGDTSLQVDGSRQIAADSAAKAQAAAAKAKANHDLAGFGSGGQAQPTMPASWFEDQLNRNNLGFEPGLGDPTDPSYGKSARPTKGDAGQAQPQGKTGGDVFRQDFNNGVGVLGRAAKSVVNGARNLVPGSKGVR